MSRGARLLWVCAAAAGLCFVALAVLSKTTLEPQGLVIFDSRLGGYGPQDARAYLDTLSPDQVKTYLTTFRWLDTLFPLLMTVFLLGFIWRNTARAPVRMRVVACLVPLAYLVLDQAENSAVAGLLRDAGPLGSQTLVGTEFEEAVLQASTYTQAKWMALAVSVLALLWSWRISAAEEAA